MGNEGASSCEERSDVVNLQSLRGIVNYLSISKAKLALVGYRLLLCPRLKTRGAFMYLVVLKLVPGSFVLYQNNLVLETYVHIAFHQTIVVVPSILLYCFRRRRTLHSAHDPRQSSQYRRVEIRVMEARGLAKADRFGLSDPYVVIYANGQTEVSL